MDIVILIMLASFLSVAILMSIIKAKDILKNKKNRVTRSGNSFSRCPVCRSPLAQGERVKSQVFSGGKSSNQMGIIESIAHIQGCPHCYPVPREERSCPVCKQSILPTDYLIGRMFDNKKTGKKHLRILGCNRCRER
ncbi:hypothetical protein WKV44_00795 [Spirochaetia bacterium 38H-sp]|uniref:Uncharacterized protein n=1 Tax=Rarispira pelagica TaxID=3141764 RepID=A0ABU9U8S8_9SPIR